MRHHHVVLLDDDPALERVLRHLFRDEWVDVTRSGSLEEIRTAVAAHPATSIVSDSWARADYATLSAEQREQLVARGRTAAVILISGATWAGKQASDEETSIILERPYHLDRLQTLVWAAAGHDPNADSAPV